jgi:hypothetical protein
MAAGTRVRLLIEWYDPELTERQGNDLLSLAISKVGPIFPDATLHSYVETNPPDDEVERQDP